MSEIPNGIIELHPDVAKHIKWLNNIIAEQRAELTRLRSLNAEYGAALSLLLEQVPVAGEWESGFTTVTYRDDEWGDLVSASNKARALLARANGGGK